MRFFRDAACFFRDAACFFCDALRFFCDASRHQFYNGSCLPDYVCSIS